MTENVVRLDTWLWAARLFKTRSLAAQAVQGGKVEVNGARAKSGKRLQAGDRLRIRKGPFEFLLEVRAVSERRGPPAVGAALYEEDPAGKRERERLAEQLRTAPTIRYEGKGRPTKKDRRRIDRLREP
jgi:ribosome-associated heat shock protein Hsp15